MGSAQSIQAAASETVLTGVVVAVAVGTWWYSQDAPSPLPADERPAGAAKKKGKKKGTGGSAAAAGASSEGSAAIEKPAVKSKSAKRQQQQQPPPSTSSAPEQSEVDSADPVAPGGLPKSLSPTPPPTIAAAPSEKKKKRNAKKATASTTATADQALAASGSGPVAGPSSQQPLPSTSAGIGSAPDGTAEDGPWTRVETRRRNEGHAKVGTSSSDGGYPPRARMEHSDAGGVTTSVTEEEGSASERREGADEEGSARKPDNRKTLAEKLLPKPRKTKVDDMLETPQQPEIARVIRITPAADEKPAPGFSWGDYGDVDEEDDDAGWGVVKRSKPRTYASADHSDSSPATSSKPGEPTKKQRQNAAKREAAKAAKAAQESEREAQLVKHRREQERARIEEQHKKTSGKGLSGGMKATVDEKGSLIWE